MENVNFSEEKKKSLCLVWYLFYLLIPALRDRCPLIWIARGVYTSLRRVAAAAPLYMPGLWELPQGPAFPECCARGHLVSVHR